jgi:hypothetical protein
MPLVVLVRGRRHVPDVREQNVAVSALRGIGDELAVVLRRPSSSLNEEFVELGGAVGPEDVGA